jgi:hypothetical protein
MKIFKFIFYISLIFIIMYVAMMTLLSSLMVFLSFPFLWYFIGFLKAFLISTGGIFLFFILLFLYLWIYSKTIKLD